MKKFLSLLALLALLLPMAVGCGKSGMSEAEITEIYRTLIEASYELNDIYYGEGLPYTDDAELIETLLGIPTEDGYSVRYLPVHEDVAYQNQAALEEATRAVFTEEICATLFEIAFTGISTDDQEKVAFARYIERDDYLTVRTDLAETAFTLGRTYDFDSMTVLIDRANRLRVEFPTFVDGEASVAVALTAIKTENGWRLDSPTY